MLLSVVGDNTNNGGQPKLNLYALVGVITNKYTKHRHSCHLSCSEKSPGEGTSMLFSVVGDNTNNGGQPNTPIP